MKKLSLTSLIFIFALNLSAQDSVIGLWKTVDDNSGKVRSIVELYQKGDEVFGKIIKTFPEPGDDPDPICDLCTDDRKDKKVIGLEFLTNMKWDDDEYVDGEILDPENGKIYRCKLWIEGDVLYVRGYIAFFFRTQTWYKYEEK